MRMVVGMKKDHIKGPDPRRGKGKYTKASETVPKLREYVLC